MSNQINRREFLKLSSMSFGSLAINPLRHLLPPEDRVQPLGIGRVTISSIGVYKEPNLKSDKLETRSRDQLMTLAEELTSPYGPEINPHWYKVVGGYSHSAYLQRVENAGLTIPSKRIRKAGQLGEISVPFANSLRANKSMDEWEALYRLYYQSVHWVTGIDEGPDGEPWYRLSDELLHLDYHVPATHVRMCG